MTNCNFVELSVGSTHTFINDSNNTQSFSVILIDANHCPGSVMFLFQGNFILFFIITKLINN